MKSFSHQATWNTVISIVAQAFAMLFVAVVSRMLGTKAFGYYVWITALPGMVVVFDMYLGLSFQNRLTEFVSTGDQEKGNRLIWGFLWGMLSVATIFIILGFLVTLVLTVSGVRLGTSTVPPFVIWLGFVQVASVSLNVPLLVAGLGYNAHREVHRGAAWALGGDLFSKTIFIIALSLTASFTTSVLVFSASTIFANCAITMRFMKTYYIHYIPASWSVVRTTFRELWRWGNAREWAGLRVVDGLFKNSDLIIGTFFISAGTIGNFALLDRLSNALMLAANAIYVPLVPALVSAAAVGEKHGMGRLSTNAKRLSVVGLVLFSLVFLSSGKWLASLWSGHRIEFPFLVVLLICVRTWTRVLSSLYWNILVGHKLIRGLLWITIASSVAYLLLYVVLIKNCGVLSIVVSHIVGQCIFIGLASCCLAKKKIKGHMTSPQTIPMDSMGTDANSNNVGRETLTVS